MPEPSIKTIIKKDYYTAAAFISGVMMWLSCIIAFILTMTIDLHPGFGLVFLILSLIVSGLGLLLISKRTKLINRLFKDGIPVEAVFDDFWQYRDHVRIRYHYNYQENTFNGKLHISSLTYGQYHSKGDKISILIDPQTPKRSIIPDAFI